MAGPDEGAGAGRDQARIADRPPPARSWVSSPPKEWPMTARVCLTAWFAEFRLVWLLSMGPPLTPPLRDGRNCDDASSSDPPAQAALDRDRRPPGQPGR